MKNVLVIGYGAVGAVYSLVLKRGGLARVTVVARSNYEITKNEGMTFKSQKYGDITGWHPDRLCASIAEAADQEYTHVLVSTKVIQEVETTSEALLPLTSPPYSDTYPQPIYVLLQNGLNIEVDLYRTLKDLKPDEEPKIINSSVYVGSRLSSKNVVEHSYFDRLDIGIYRPTPNILVNTPEELDILNSISDILKAGGTTINIVPEIQRVKFEKNIWNAVLGPITVLTGHSFQSIFRPPQITLENPTFDQAAMPHAAVDGLIIPAASQAIAETTIPFIYDIILEVCAVGNALYPSKEDGDETLFPREKAKDILRGMGALASKATSKERPSILVDVESGRPTEVEVLVGEVVRMGRKLAIPIPRLETFYALLLVTQTELLRKKKGQ